MSLKQGRESIRSVCYSWWKSRLGAESELDSSWRGYRGAARMARAQLRRAGTPLEVLAVAAVHDLYGKLIDSGWQFLSDTARADRLAVVAVALANIERNSEFSLARQFGRQNAGIHCLSEIRFQRLIRCIDHRDLMHTLRRSIATAKGNADVGQLAYDLLVWNDDTRNRWCFEYYGESREEPEGIALE